MKRYVFRWVSYNLDHAAKHGVSVVECEQIVRAGKYRHAGDGKYRAVGRGDGGRWLQVVFTVTAEAEAFVIHARPLTDTEIRRERRRNR
jgi:uncharacterized DUF497 family protein